MSTTIDLQQTKIKKTSVKIDYLFIATTQGTAMSYSIPPNYP